MKGIGVPGEKLKKGNPQRDRQPCVANPDETLMATVHLNIVQIPHLLFKDAQGEDEDPGKMSDEEKGDKINLLNPGQSGDHIADKREIENPEELTDHPFPNGRGIQ